MLRSRFRPCRSCAERDRETRPARRTSDSKVRSGAARENMKYKWIYHFAYSRNRRGTSRRSSLSTRGTEGGLRDAGLDKINIRLLLMICLKIDGYERQSVFTPHPKPRIVQPCAAAICPASVRFRDTRRDRTNPLLSSLTVVKTVIDSESFETTVLTQHPKFSRGARPRVDETGVTAT